MWWKLCTSCWFPGDEILTTHSSLYVTAAPCSKQYPCPWTPEWSPRLHSPLPLPPSKLCLVFSKVGKREQGGERKLNGKGERRQVCRCDPDSNNSRPKTPSLEAKKGSIRAKGLDVFLNPVSLSFLPPHSSEVSFQKNSHFIINTRKKTLFICLSSPLPTEFLLQSRALWTSWGCLVQQVISKYLLSIYCKWAMVLTTEGATWYKHRYKVVPREDPRVGRKLVIYQSVVQLTSSEDKKGYTGSCLPAPEGACATNAPNFKAELETLPPATSVLPPTPPPNFSHLGKCHLLDVSIPGPPCPSPLLFQSTRKSSSSSLYSV